MSKLKYILLILVILVILTALWLVFFNQHSEMLTLEDKVKAYCEQSDVAEVHISEKYIKVVSVLPEVGATYYPLEGNDVFSCPNDLPGLMVEPCQTILKQKDWVVVCKH